MSISLYNLPRRQKVEVEIWLYPFFNLGVRQGGWLMPNSGRFTLGNDLIPIVQETVWAPQPDVLNI